MKHLVEIGHLTKYDALRVNRDQAINFEIWLTIRENVSNFDAAYPKIISTLEIFMISEILFKMSKHSDFLLSLFQVVVYSCRKTDKVCQIYSA